jgi:hypothetical protein
MTLSARRLGPDDAEAARQLGMEAFGVSSSPPTSSATIDQPETIWFGAFEDDLLVAGWSIVNTPTVQCSR